MRACVRVLGLLAPLGGCFVDPGNATVGGPGGGTTTGGTGGAEVTGAVSTGSTAQVPEPTGTSTGSTTTGEVLPGTDTGGTTGGTDGTGGTTGTATTLDASTGGSSTGGLELPVPGCVPLFFADFSQDPKDMLDLQGNWTWNQDLGTVTVTTKDGETSQALTKGSWQDSVVYARVRVSSGYAVVRTRQGAGLLGGHYFGSMQPWTGKLQLGRKVNGQSTVFKNPTFPTQVGVWYTMAIRAQGSDLSFGLDDQVLTGASDGQLTMGRASIGGYLMGEAEFDWFLVCAAD